MSGLQCRVCRVIAEEQKYKAFKRRVAIVIILVCFYDQLLSFIPLYKFIRAGTDRLLCISCRIAVSMLWHDPQGSRLINKGGHRRLHAEHDRCVVSCLGLVQQRQINGGNAVFLGLVVCKGYIACGEFLTIMANHIIANFERPGKAVLADAIFGGKVIFQLIVCIRIQQLALKDGSTAAPPSRAGIISGFLLPANRNNYFIFCSYICSWIGGRLR